ncbi:MAG: GNAT family N-acetyltransferase [Planctomycetes bacterium]|nr:GNAT family N-acetyltransferase [Planctomycetota bacterium]
MPSYQLAIRCAADELRDSAADWDDLWQRSEVALPLTRAELVAMWAEHFAAGGVQGLMAYDGPWAVAALPIALNRKLGVGLAGLPNHPQFTAGDLMLDPAADARQALALLAEGLEQLPSLLAWFELVPYEAPRWRQLLDVLTERGWRIHQQPSYTTGVIELPTSWDVYDASRSSNHRRQLRKAERRAKQAGDVTLRVLNHLRSAEVAKVLGECFAIEDRSWKGAEGSSMARTPGQAELSLRIAQQLAAWGQLHVALLEVGGRAVAFELGCQAKGTYFSPKIGHDPQFANLSPGQLLRHELLQHFVREQSINRVDFWGPLTEATARWATTSYPVGRVVAAPPRTSSRVAWHAYRTLRAARNAFRHEQKTHEVKPVGLEDVPSSNQQLATSNFSGPVTPTS